MKIRDKGDMEGNSADATWEGWDAFVLKMEQRLEAIEANPDRPRMSAAHLFERFPMSIELPEDRWERGLPTRTTER